MIMEWKPGNYTKSELSLKQAEYIKEAIRMAKQANTVPHEVISQNKSETKKPQNTVSPGEARLPGRLSSEKSGNRKPGIKQSGNQKSGQSGNQKSGQSGNQKSGQSPESIPYDGESQNKEKTSRVSPQEIEIESAIDESAFDEIVFDDENDSEENENFTEETKQEDSVKGNSAVNPPVYPRRTEYPAEDNTRGDVQEEDITDSPPSFNDYISRRNRSWENRSGK
jgi:hypothetical protein